MNNEGISLTLAALLNEYRQREFGRGLDREMVQSEEAFAQCFPVITYRAVENDLQNYFPDGSVFFLRTRGFTGSFKLIPYSARLLTASVSSFSRWLSNQLDPGAFVLCLEPLAEETANTTWGSFPSFRALPKQLAAANDRIVLVEKPTNSTNETERWNQLTERLPESTIILIGSAALAIKYLRFLGRRRPQVMHYLRKVLLTGLPEIGSFFAPELNRLVPAIEIREFYSAAEGMFAWQVNEPSGLSWDSSTCFFELETAKIIKPLSRAVPGESGSLIVSSEAFPRYRIGDFVLCDLNGRLQVLGKDGRTTRFGYYLHHLFPSRS
jgi:hypothetical protein